MMAWLLQLAGWIERIGVAWAVLVPAALFATAALTPALRNLRAPTRPSPAPRYIAALRIVAPLGALLHIGAGAAWLAWRPAAGTLPAYSPVDDLDRFMRSVWNPWLDVVLDEFGSSGMPILSQAWAWLNQAAVTATLPEPLYALVLALLWLLGWGQRHVLGGDGGGWWRVLGLDGSGAPAPWLRMAAWPAVVLGGLGALIGVAMLPILATGPGIPVMAWATAWVVLVLTLGVLLSRGEAPPPEPPVEAPPAAERPPPLRRQHWERFLHERGVLLRRATHAGGAAVLDLAGSGAAGAAEEPDGVQPWSHAWEPPLVAADMLLLDGSSASRRPWPHQERFVRHVNEVRAGGGDRAVLLHAGWGSGRSTAVFEAAVQGWLRANGRALLVYPSAERARSAVADLRRLIDASAALPRRPVVALAGQDVIGDDTAIVCVDVEELGTRLLPSRDPAVRGLWAALEFLALEDTELYSGVRATNLRLLLRRVERVLTRLGARPVWALSLCANPTELSGAQEYAQALAGGRRLVEAAQRDDAPRKDVFTYALERAPKLRDAQGVDALPASVQVGWLSAAFGATVAHTHADAVTRSDLGDAPGHIAALARARAVALGPLEGRLAAAWVHVHEVGLDDALTLGSRIAHGGIRPEPHGSQADADEHLVVAVPAMQHRPLVRWLLPHWLRAREVDGAATAGTWNRDILPVGNRVIAGHAGTEAAERHLRCAIAELPATEGELVAILSGAGLSADGHALDVRAKLGAWLEAGELRAARRRRFDPLHKVALVERIYALAVQPPRSPPLDATAGALVPLLCQGQVVRRLDGARWLRQAYPGRLWLHEGRRLRIHDPQLDATGALAGGLAASDDDIAAFTEPCQQTTWTLLRPCGAAQEHSFGGGRPLRMWRGRYRAVLRHVGRWELRDGGDGERLLASWAGWAGPALAQASEVEALTVVMPLALSATTRATLRRMLAACLGAVVRLPPEDLDIDVLAGDPAQTAGDPASEATTVLLRDPWPDGAGLLPGLGAEPARFVEHLLKLAWLWADDLAAADGGPTGWDAIGYQRGEPGDDALSPDPAVVRDTLALVLGERAARWQLDEDPQHHEPLRPLGPPSPEATPDGHDGYWRVDPAAVRGTVEAAIGGPIRAGEWRAQDLLACWEWVHAHIRYQSDLALYGRREYVASPAETLHHRAGDCEDHANLLASMAAALGARARLVLTVDHAHAQVCLGDKDAEAFCAAVREATLAVSAGHALEPGDFANSCGKIGRGWRRRGAAAFERTGVGAFGVFSVREELEQGVVVDRDADGSAWVSMDSCSARVLGSVRGLVNMGNRGKDGAWRAGSVMLER